MPFVSICIPTYNQVEFLALVMNSLIEQTYQDFEVIVSDDSTSDEVSSLVSEYKGRLNLRYFRNQPSQGAIRNWNHCLKMAEGEVVKLMHHDDYFSSPTSLEQLVTPFLQENTMIVASAANVKNVRNQTETVFRATESQLQMLKDNPILLLKGNFIGPPSALMYRNHCKFDYDERLKWLVDIEAYLRMFSEGKKFVYISDPLYVSVQGEHNITADCIEDPQLELVEVFYVLKKHWKYKDIFVLVNVLHFWLKHLSKRGLGSYIKLMILFFKNLCFSDTKKEH